MVGDRLDTDMKGARAAGIPSLHVLTGVDRPKQLVAASDALLIAGSSLVVNSGIRLLERARRRRLPIVIVNRGETRGDRRATVKIDAGTTEVLQAFARALPAAGVPAR